MPPWFVSYPQCCCRWTYMSISFKYMSIVGKHFDAKPFWLFRVLYKHYKPATCSALRRDIMYACEVKMQNMGRVKTVQRLQLPSGIAWKIVKFGRSTSKQACSHIDSITSVVCCSSSCLMLDVKRCVISLLSNDLMHSHGCCISEERCVSFYSAGLSITPPADHLLTQRTKAALCVIMHCAYSE